MRERILAAAVTVMRECGVTNTTTKQVARVAGVAEGSIYNHFANKSELIAASMAEVAGGIRNALTRLSGRVGTGTVEDNLTELAEAEIAFFIDLLPITGPVLGNHDLRDWLRQGGPQYRLQAQARKEAQTQARNRAQAQDPTQDQAQARNRAQAQDPTQDQALRRTEDRGGDQHQAPGHGPVRGRGGNPEGPPPGPVLGHVLLIGYLEAEQRAGRLPHDVEPPYLAAALIGACQQYAFVSLLTQPEIMAQVAGLPADPREYARGVVRAILPRAYPA